MPNHPYRTRLDYTGNIFSGQHPRTCFKKKAGIQTETGPFHCCTGIGFYILLSYTAFGCIG